MRRRHVQEINQDRGHSVGLLTERGFRSPRLVEAPLARDCRYIEPFFRGQAPTHWRSRAETKRKRKRLIESFVTKEVADQSIQNTKRGTEPSGS